MKIFTLTLLLLTSCNEQVVDYEGRDSKGINEITTVQSSKRTQLLGNTIINNDLSANPFENEIDIDYLISLGFKSGVVLSENAFDETITDTTFIFTNTSNSKIVLKKQDNRHYVSSATLMENSVKLRYDLRVGLHQKEVFKLLGIDFLSVGELEITDDENWNTCKLIFKNQILQKVEVIFGEN